MGYRIVNTDPGPEDQDWSQVKFATEQAAKAHARYLNEEVARAVAKDPGSNGA